MKRRTTLLPMLLVLAVACDERTADEPESRVPDITVVYAPPAEYRAGHFALGRAPTRAQLAAWDTDIGPEGFELPPGRGSARDGAAIYAAQCAACHGVEGQGLHPVYPAVIGRDPRGEDFAFSADATVPRTIGNYWSHATTLYDYIRRAMPLYTPGSLNADETYAVTAFLLAANRVIPDTAVLDAAALRAVQMPARDRFTPDDRSPTRH